jgi:hypothetical protein
LKKRTKKLLLLKAAGLGTDSASPHALRIKGFFAAFFSKKAVLSFFSP